MNNSQAKQAVVLVVVIVVALLVYSSASGGVVKLWQVLPSANYPVAVENSAIQSSQSAASSTASTFKALSTSTSTLPAESAAMQIIARPPVAPADIVIASRPERSQITRGAFVWTPEKIAFGTVADVRERTVVIELFSRAQKSTSALLGGSVPIDLVGFGGRDFRVNIPENTPVTVGDVAIHDEFNVPIGAVAATDDAEALGKKRVFITSLVPLFEVETLYVESN